MRNLVLICGFICLLRAAAGGEIEPHNGPVLPPENTRLEQAKPVDPGAVVIPESLFPDGKGLPIPIHVPEVVGGSNASFGDWETVKDITGSDVRFSTQKLLQGLVTSTPAGSPVEAGERSSAAKANLDAGIGLSSYLIHAFGQAFETNAFCLTIQKSRHGERRVVIQILLDEGNALRARAGDVISTPSTGIAAVAASDFLQKRYSLPPGSRSYRGAWVIDKKHKKDPYVAYMCLAPAMNAVVLVPKVYSGDRFVITKDKWLVWPETVLELRGQEYVSAHTSLLPLDSAEALRVLELVATTPAPVKQATPPRNGKILMVMGMDGLYALNPDGSEKTRILPEIRYEVHVPYEPLSLLCLAAISPDGKRCAFPEITSDILKGGIFNWTGRITTINSDGSQRRPLPMQLSVIQNLRWSPDGTKIAFFAACGRKLYVMNQDGTGLRCIAQETGISGAHGYLSFLTWSPDGRRIMFSSAGQRLSLVDGDGGMRTDISLEHQTGPGKGRSFVVWCPEWAPDGRRLAFCNTNHQLCLGTLGNGKFVDVKPLTVISGVPLAVPVGIRWSPDGSRIAVSTWHEISVINASGGDLRRIFETSEQPGPTVVEWLPDEAKLPDRPVRNVAPSRDVAPRR